MKRDSSDLERAACDPATVVVPPFVLANADAPARAVLLSVPHAGRYYPQSLLEAARVPVEALQRLEDRYVDRLTGDAAEQGFMVQTATHARAFIDLHSMPGLGGIAPATLVIGDRHGATAPPWLVEAIEQEVQSVGLRIAYNRPYAGGYIIARHSRPERRRYAVQIEIDRTAYLDAQGQPERAACARLSALVARVATVAEFALAERFGPPLWSQAAE